MSKYRIILDGKTYEMEVEKIDGSAMPNVKASPVHEATPTKSAVAPTAPAASVGINTVSSPMPGTILKVNVRQGDVVYQGQVVLVLEAMKMENEILAPKGSKVTALFVDEGDTVHSGQQLFEIGE